MQHAVTMPVAGALATRLVAAAGDRRVAVFKADTGDVVAGSASRGGREAANGFAVAGERRLLDLRTDCKVRR